jgi:hypothetical protein
LKNLVDIWWCPANGPAAKTNMTLAADRIARLAEACAEWELANIPPPRHGGLRTVTDDGAV